MRQNESRTPPKTPAAPAAGASGMGLGLWGSLRRPRPDPVGGFPLPPLRLR